PLLVQRGDALVAVGGEGGGAPGGVLDVEGGVEGDLEAGAQGVLGVAQPHGRVGGDLGRELGGDGAVLAGGDAAVDQPEGVGLVDADLAAGVDEVGSRGGADPARQQLGAAAARDQADANLGQAEDGGLVGDDEVAGQRQLQPAAEGVAVDGGDTRHRQL